MWCQRCQQDVPGVFSTETGQYRCPRCAGEFRVESPGEVEGGTEDAVQSVLPESVASAPPLPILDGWELDEQLKHVERVLVAGKPDGKVESRPRTRVDQAHALGTRHTRPRRTRPSRKPKRSSPSLLQVVVWPLMGLGLMMFVCGSVLVGWSLVAGRTELWNIGLPVALVGQIGLLTSLVLQLERIWNDHRTAVAKLEHVDEELHGLKTATTLLSTTHSTAGSSFYAHLAGGASPQLLLTDLKSQLDLLAVKLDQDGG